MHTASKSRSAAGRKNLAYLLSITRYGRRTSAAILLSITSPVCLPACTEKGIPPATEPECETQIYIQKIEKATSGALDLFFFNDDNLMRLDSYQRIPIPGNGKITGASGSGRKIAAGVMNLKGDIWSWSDICSLSGLTGRTASLMDEDPSFPVCSGLSTILSGVPCRMDMSPLMARISVHSICCDFSMRPYKGQELEDVSIYLINVNSECSIFPEEKVSPSSWINLSMYDASQASGMAHPEMVYRKLGSGVGAQTVFPDVTLRCYPNGNESDGFGSPMTRLVIEGKLMGITYYYPINLPALGKGEHRSFDISITRTGTADPDIAADIWTSDEGMVPKPWDIHDNTVVNF